ncbi:ABC transporter permease [Dactylosporangium darangshiense]|uniref:ABC-2 type transporter transmembrane domain-containing protein n=1 Tax=Dactylosporangium darangshiense TaxID=579108 RepID=A0ABP8D758_9ACTN
MTDSLLRIAALARHNAVLRRRDPGQFLSYLVMPMLLMSVLAPVFRRAAAGGSAQVVTGMLVIYSTLALSIVGTATLAERVWHTWDRLRVTRAGGAELLLGKTLPAYAVLLLQQAALLTYGAVVVGARPHGPAAYGLLAVAVAVWSATLLAVGNALAAVVRSFGELGAACDIGALAFATLGGALVPTSMFPAWLRPAAPASPGYWALSMLQAAMRGDVHRTLVPAAVLLIAGLAAGAFAVRRLTRAQGRTTLL